MRQMAAITEFTLPAFDDAYERRPSCPPCMTIRQTNRKPTISSATPSILSPTASRQMLQHQQQQQQQQSQLHHSSFSIDKSTVAKLKSRSLSSLTANAIANRRGTTQCALEEDIKEETAASSAANYVSPPLSAISAVAVELSRNNSSTIVAPASTVVAQCHSNACSSAQRHLVDDDLAYGERSPHSVSTGKWCPFFEFNDVLTCLHRQPSSKMNTRLAASSNQPPLIKQTINMHDEHLRMRNYSSSLELTKLENGQFVGRLPTTAFPLGDIEVRLKENTLEFFIALGSGVSSATTTMTTAGSCTSKSGGGTAAINWKVPVNNNNGNGRVLSPVIGSGTSRLAKQRKSGEMAKVGELNLPIYVNPATVQVELNTSDDSITIGGMMKGYLDTSRSSLTLLHNTVIGGPGSSSCGISTNASLNTTPKKRMINPRIFSRLQFSKRSSSTTSPAASRSINLSDDLLQGCGRLRSHTT